MKRPAHSHLLFILLLLLLPSLAAVAFAVDATGKMELTPRSIMQHVNKDGARLTISRLRNEKTGRKTNFEWIILKVESGELVWLQVADALLPGLEPSFQQSLFVSGAKAMGKHPENAVRLLKEQRWPLEYLCDAPFHEISREGWESHLLTVQTGLRGFEHLTFQREKELCLRYIDWALERYPQPMPKDLVVGWSVPQELP